MADSFPSLEKLKFWKWPPQTDEQWAMNMKLLRATGLFAGSILLMRNFGDLMAV